ncbi:hypothetical protein GO988_20865 [Hymenobacter sp. HMF4947]|uniref:STAS/SEC14 domain-containing protein n=1 Tax=Hymenobacter ginkgonis TaxID=2682976 RepID=A0A7K1TK92_9BACT|nr:hypothetical protein [Hymenobacter ginkgonis]MVN78792.1 hypothetical protein [Hymenobacter ginkgonis]
MLLNSLSFRTGGQCTLSLEQTDGWLRAVWSGYITTDDAMRGALNYLAQVGPFHTLYLLNDNTSLRGPWFDSVEWLDRVWLPQAIQLGLRYIAHVVQADTHNDILTLACPAHITDVLELQLFDDVASAQEWLRTCQLPLNSPARLSQAVRKP